VIRIVSFLSVLFVLALGGCKEPPGQSGDLSLLRAGSDVVIKGIQTYQPQDAVAGSNDVWYVVTFTFTNNQGMTLAPRINHFVVQDDQNRRYLGTDSGSAALVGISNYDGVLKVGEAHDYTVGFRVPQDFRGVLFYDNSF